MSDVQATCFDLLGEAAVYTSAGGGTAVQIRAEIDEPNEQPFPRDIPRSAFRERGMSVWLPRVDNDGAVFSPAKGGTVALLDEAGNVARTVELVSLQAQDPHHSLWACRET